MDRTTAPGAPGDTAECPHCGTSVPDSSFCGGCGASLGDRLSRGSARRLHSYAAFPDEPVLRLSAVSSLFPGLTNRSRSAFRAVFALATAALVALALARLGPAVTAVSAVAVPLLFICYVAETERDPQALRTTLAVMIVGAGLGVACALVLGRLVSDALVPTVGSSLASPAVLRSALLVPAVVQLLMVAPVGALRLRPPPDFGPLQGFTVGASGALGVAAAVVLTELGSGVLAGNLSQGSPLTVLGQAVVRGISVPLIGAAASGYVGGALWRTSGGKEGPAAGRWLTSPLVALAIGMLLQVGLGFADDAGLDDAILIAVHLLATLLALVALRVGLHHLLLHDRRAVPVGAPRPCPHCHDLASPMRFCPGCGVAQRASALVGAPGRPGHGRLFAVVGAGLALVTGLFVALAAVLPARAAAPCVALRCFSPFGPVQIQRGQTYTSPAGWSVTWYPARAVLPGPAPLTRATTGSDELHLTFTSSTSPAEDGDLYFVGGPAHGQDPAQLVASLQHSSAPNATLDYVLPNPTIGYHIGYGASFETTPPSSYGNNIIFEVVITCAVVDGYAVCAYGVGPRVDLNRVVNHPTPSKLALSLWSDPDVNSVTWTGSAVRSGSLRSRDNGSGHVEGRSCGPRGTTAISVSTRAVPVRLDRGRPTGGSPGAPRPCRREGRVGPSGTGGRTTERRAPR